jgi:hypothetical protein
VSFLVFSSPRQSKDLMLVPRTGRIWETVCPGGLSPSWFGVKTLDSAIAGTSQGASSHTSSPVHNIKQNKIPLVFRILTTLDSSYLQQRSNLTIYTSPNNFILTTSSKGSSLPGSPFSLANFKHTIRPNPSPPKNLIPKHQHSLPCLAMGLDIIVSMTTVNPGPCS